jgi:hypothetical protein
MGSREIGSTQSIPFNSTKTSIQMDSEIPVGGWLYLDSGILINGNSNDPSYYVSQLEGEDILNGDLNRMKTALLNGFKAQEPQSTIEITWLKISWATADFQHINLTTGYKFTNFRIEAAIKNVNAGLAPIIIAAILIAIPIIIAITTLCLTIAWVAFMIVKAAENLAGDGGIIIIGFIVLIGMSALLFFALGGGASGNKKSFKLQGQNILRR